MNNDSSAEDIQAITDQEVAKALAAVYTSAQLRHAVELRRQLELSPQQVIDPFDTPAEDGSDEAWVGECSPCTGACVTSDGEAACDEG